MDEDLYNQIFSKTEEKIETESASYKEYKFDPEDFLDKSVIWYGTTGSGKSFHMKYCLSEIKHIIPKVVLFSTTNHISKDFENIIHEALIYDELTEHRFVQIIKAQIEVAELYRRINNAGVIYEVFLACASERQKNMYNTIDRNLQEACRKITGPENIKASEILKLKKQVNEKLIHFMKYVIIPERNKIDVGKLSEAARECVKYIDLNPHLLIIFDDCQEEIKDLIGKKKSEASLMFKNLFTRGRHYFMSHWYSMQDDSALPPPLRKNAKVSILTQGSLANSFISRASNGIDQDSKKLGLGLCKKLFQNDGDHRKIIYFKERAGQEKFQFHKAEDPGVFHIGSVFVNEFCDEVH